MRKQVRARAGTVKYGEAEEGDLCLQQPRPCNIEDCAKQGYLKKYAQVAKALGAYGDGKCVPVWAVAERAGVSKRIAERAAASMGLGVYYIDPKRYNSKAVGLRRGILVDYGGVNEWIRAVKKHTKGRRTC